MRKTKTVKRKRGGATHPCPRCDARSRVLNTRKVGMDRQTTVIVRWRECMKRQCKFRFATQEQLQ